MSTAWAFVLLGVFVAILVAARLLVMTALKRTVSKPAKIVRTSGLRVVFGCGHEERRSAVLECADGRLRTRSIPKPEARERNCHDCYLATGQDGVKNDAAPPIN